MSTLEVQAPQAAYREQAAKPDAGQPSRRGIGIVELLVAALLIGLLATIG